MKIPLFKTKAFAHAFTMCFFSAYCMGVPAVNANELYGMDVVQQQISVKGVVVDNQGEPVIGASVVQENTTHGTITDLNGEFKLTVSVGAMLKITFIGYKDVIVKALGTETLKVVLVEDTETLDEVVVVGYGVVKKSDLTSSISTMKGNELQKVASGNPLSALQGKVSGVQITNTSGAPGSTPRVIIRGVTSQNGSEPLYVVDGIPGVSMNSINSNDILSMEILKDAAATSIYGTRGSNGVVLITTKKGRTNSPMKFSVSLKQGIQHIPRPEIASAEEYKKVYNARFENDGMTPPVDFANSVETDWWKEVVRPLAPMGEYNFSFEGGGEKFAYSGSLGYYRQESQTKGKGYWDRLSARVNLEYTVNKYVKFGQDFVPRIENSESFYEAGIGTAMQYDPTIPVYRPLEEREGLDEFSIYSHSRHTTVWNPVASQARTFGQNKWFGFLSNTYAQVEPIKGLVLRTQFGFNTLHSENNGFVPEFNLGGTEKQDINKVTAGFSSRYDWTWNNTLTYMTQIEKHHLTGMLGFVMEENNTHSLSASREAVPNNYNEALRYINAGTLNDKANGIKNSSSLMSYLGRFMYNYDNRYYLTATYRIDGSSKFVGKNQYAHFPSVSAAYNLKNESFLQDNNWLSALKLRASWGKVGNQNIPVGAFEDKIVSNQVVLGNDVAVGSKLSAIANKDIKWEVVEDYNIGVDVGFCNRVNLSAEWFTKKSHDMLMQASNLLITGLPMSGAKMWTNIGSMKATGLEFSVNVSDYSKDFKYDIGLNFTTIKNTAEKLVDNAPQYTGSFLGLTTHKTEPGGEIGRFYLYKADGLFKSKEEVEAHKNKDGNLIQPKAQPGDIRFVDMNGDGVLDEDDKYYAGSSLPKVTFGLNSHFEYKGFDLSISINGNLGNKIFNSQKQRLENGYAGVNVRKGLFNEVWTENNINASIPILSEKDLNGNFKKPSTYFLENGSYAKIQNLQIGYTFHLKSFYNMKWRIFASAQNLYTFTKYSGADPEVASGGGILSSGIDWFPYAQPKTFILGLNLNF